MMKKHKTEIAVPPLRFKGFDGEWAEKRLGDVVRKRNESVLSGDLPKVEYEDVVSFEGVLKRNIEELKVAKRGVLFCAGDVLFGKLRPYLGNWLFAPFDGVAVGDWWVLKTEDVVPEYLYSLIQAERFQIAANQSAGSKMPRADWRLVSETKYPISPTEDEQYRVGVTFRSLDMLIASRETALEKLQTLKKAMLEKMFPRAGAKVPEVRFKGFEGEWEEKRLGEIVTFSKGKGYSKSDITEEGYPLFLYGRMYTNYQIEVSSVETFCKLRDDSVLSKGGEVVCPASGETAEDIACASAVVEKGIVLGGDLNILTPRKGANLDSVFLAMCLTYGTARNAIKDRAQGKTVVHVHNSDFIDIDVLVPSLPEQRKIGAYFRSLDALISARRDEIAKLKDLKKALLDRMFV